jgi:hypothetical protein
MHKMLAVLITQWPADATAGSTVAAAASALITAPRSSRVIADAGTAVGSTLATIVGSNPGSIAAAEAEAALWLTGRPSIATSTSAGAPELLGAPSTAPALADDRDWRAFQQAPDPL